MRGSTALLIAGAAVLVSGTAGPVLAADEPAPVAPAPVVETLSDGAPPEEPAPETLNVDEPDAEEPGGLARPSLDAVIEERDDRRREARATARPRDESKKLPLADASVTMKDIEFKPRTLSISPGDRVTWTNRDTAQHNAVDDGEFRTPLLEKGERASVTIDDAGTYNYVCTVHPGMNGKLVAESGGSGGSNDSAGSGGSSSSSGGTGASPASSGSGALPSSSSGSSSRGGSSGSLPNTGQEQLPLLILGAGLIVAGLLVRAFHEYWIWR
jgi:LPXTG-motif cell wall-anchored protein